MISVLFFCITTKIVQLSLIKFYRYIYRADVKCTATEANCWWFESQQKSFFLIINNYAFLLGFKVITIRIMIPKVNKHVSMYVSIYF